MGLYWKHRKQLRQNIRKHRTENILDKTFVDDVEKLGEFVVMLLNKFRSLETHNDKDDEPKLTCEKCQFETQNNLLLTNKIEAQNI